MPRRRTNAGRYSTSNAAVRYSTPTDVSNHIHCREKMLSGVFYDTLTNPMWFKAVDMSMPGNQGVYKIRCLFNYNLRKALRIQTFTARMYTWLTSSGRRSLSETVFSQLIARRMTKTLSSFGIISPVNYCLALTIVLNELSYYVKDWRWENIYVHFHD